MSNKFFYSEVTIESPLWRKSFVAPGIIDSSYKLVGEDEYRDFVSLHDEKTNVEVTSRIYAIGSGYARKTFMDDITDAVECGKKYRNLHKQCDFFITIHPQVLTKAYAGRTPFGNIEC